MSSKGRRGRPRESEGGVSSGKTNALEEDMMGEVKPHLPRGVDFEGAGRSRGWYTEENHTLQGPHITDIVLFVKGSGRLF